MAYPANVGGTWSSHLNARVGPFEYNGNLYAVLNSSTDLEIYKSTDDGSSWSLVASQTEDALPTADAVQSGAKIYIAHAVDANHFSVSVFDMSTDLFDIALGSLKTRNDNLSGTSPLFIALRSNGNYVVVHQGPTEKVSGTNYRRIRISEYNGTGWTDYTHSGALSFQSGTSEHYDLTFAILGASDRVHFVYSISSASGARRHRTFTSSNTVGNEQTLTGGATDSFSTGIGDFDGSEFAVMHNGGAKTPEVERATSADNPSFTGQDISATDAEYVNSNPGSIAYGGGGTLHAVYVRDDDQNIEYTNDQGTGTWATPEAFATATTQGISARMVSSDSYVGVLYDDGGTVKYDRKSVSSTTTTAITKGLQYTVVSSSAITQSLQYTVKTSTAVTQSLQYTVRSSQSVTKSLKYTVDTSQSTTQSLQYTVQNVKAITQSLQYTVITSPSVIRSLKYTVDTSTSITKSTKYTIETTTTDTRSLQYTVVSSQAITKSLHYEVESSQSITRPLKYTVPTTSVVSLPLGYYVVIVTTVTKGLRYYVKSAQAVTQDLKYTVVTSSVDIKSQEYRVQTVGSVSNTLSYSVISKQRVEKSLEYTVEGGGGIGVRTGISGRGALRSDNIRSGDLIHDTRGNTQIQTQNRR